MALYNQIGIGYNQTRQADPYLASRLYNHLQPKPDGHYLDVGCGTGNYTIALWEKGVCFTGIDPSTEMLEKARARDSEIAWKLGTAENTGLESESMDGAMATLTIHHWPSLEKGFREIHRVLKDKSRFVLFTSTPDQMRGYWLNHYFPVLMEVGIQQMPAIEKVLPALESAGFTLLETEPYSVRPDLQDLFLYSGKYDPERYFLPEIRKGISTFASLANKEEVDHGLQLLRRDITSGKIKDIMRSYENEEGDYLFVIAQHKAR